MNEGRKHTTNRTTRSLRFAGLPLAVVLALLTALALGGSAVAGTARATVAPANTSPPAISGTVSENQMLTATSGAWTGTESITYAYAWQRCDSGGGHCATINHATNTTYTLTKQDVNHTLRFVVTAKNADGTVTATSVATAVAAAAAKPAPPAKTATPTNTSAPIISGTVQEGQTLTADKGGWSGTEPITYTFSWQRCDTGGGHCSNIGGSNHTTYTVQKADVNNTLRVVVSAKNAGGTTTATSVATAIVKAAVVTPPPSLTLSASTLAVVYGTGTTLSGTISTKLAGESVSVLAQPYAFPDAKFSTVATVTTGSGGTWSYLAKPTIRTAYQANWKTATSSTLTVGVHPIVTLQVITGNRLLTKVAAGHSFATRIVQVQRRSSLGQWVTIKQLRLNTNSTAVFSRTLLPRGTSTVRIAFSVNQAGAGYLGGISRTIVLHRA